MRLEKVPYNFKATTIAKPIRPGVSSAYNEVVRDLHALLAVRPIFPHDLRGPQKYRGSLLATITFSPIL